MSFLTGNLRVNSISFVFAFDGNYLKLIARSNEDYMKLSCKEIHTGVYIPIHNHILDDCTLFGNCNETGQSICFIFPENTTFTTENGTIKLAPLAYVDVRLKNHKYNCLKFSCDELDSIYPLSNAYQFLRDDENNIIGATSTQNASEDVLFDFLGRRIESCFYTECRTGLPNQSPFDYKTILSYEFDETDDYFFLYRLTRIALVFVQFLCFRKNIKFTRVTLLSAFCDAIVEAGTIHMIYDAEIDDKEKIKNKYIPYLCIKGFEGKIMQRIADDTLYTRHFPKSYMDGKTIDPAKFIMLTAAFEWEFKTTFPNGLEKSESRIKAERDAINKLDELIENTSGKEKKIYKSLRNHIEDADYSSKIQHVSKTYKDILHPFATHLYTLNSKGDPDYVVMGDRLGNQRNNFAHGNIDKEFNSDTLLDIILLEYYIYAMQMKKLGMPDSCVRDAINNLFNLRIRFNDSLNGK